MATGGRNLKGQETTSSLRHLHCQNLSSKKTQLVIGKLLMLRIYVGIQQVMFYGLHDVHPSDTLFCNVVRSCMIFGPQKL